MIKIEKMKRYIAMLLFLFLYSNAFPQSFKSSAYPGGVYLFCGFEIPKHFSYEIERKTEAGDWISIAQLNAPKSEVAVNARFMALPRSLAKLSKISSQQVKMVWQQAQSSLLLDSLYFYAHDPRIQFAVGCGWFDEEISNQGTYEYRVSKVNRSEEKKILSEFALQYPGVPYNGKLKVREYSPQGNAITITYSLTDSLFMAGITLFRSPYLVDNYVEVASTAFFTQKNGKTVVEVVDASVADGLAYSYFAQPFNPLGKFGLPSDTINIYNLRKTADIGLITKFEAIPDGPKQVVQLNWKLNTALHITSIDVYRSNVYEKQYQKIASVSPSENEYIDKIPLEPAKAYYYYIVANNGYGYSQPSARTPVIIKGNKTNLLPPQHLKAKLNGNIVTLTFSKVEPDTRGYYVYRANGYTGQLEQLPDMVLSTDSLVSFTDTLVPSTEYQIFSYAVADINTSYNISPTSDRVSIQFSGGMLPIPTNLEAMLRNSQSLLVWDDVSVNNPTINAYTIMRSTFDENENLIESEEIIGKTSSFANSFTDTTIQQGFHYIYKVQSVGFNNELSSPSLQAGVTFPIQPPLRPGKVMAYTSGDDITIQWDLPADNSVTKLKIYRTVANEKASLLAELPATQASYIDNKVRKKTIYFYYVVTENNRGLESDFGDPVSAIVR